MENMRRCLMAGNGGRDPDGPPIHHRQIMKEGDTERKAAKRKGPGSSGSNSSCLMPVTAIPAHLAAIVEGVSPRCLMWRCFMYKMTDGEI
jgi:hypothetical protein